MFAVCGLGGCLGIEPLFAFSQGGFGGVVATRRSRARVPRFGGGGVAERCDRNKGIESHELS